MSYFVNHVIYIVIPIADLTEEMLNLGRNYFNVKGDVSSNSLRKNNDGTKCIMKVIRNIAHAHEYTSIKGYRWYSHEDILTEMENAEWVESS